MEATLATRHQSLWTGWWNIGGPGRTAARRWRLSNAMGWRPTSSPSALLAASSWSRTASDAPKRNSKQCNGTYMNIPKCNSKINIRGQPAKTRLTQPIDRRLAERKTRTTSQQWKCKTAKHIKMLKHRGDISLTSKVRHFDISLESINWACCKTPLYLSWRSCVIRDVRRQNRQSHKLA